MNDWKQHLWLFFSPLIRASSSPAEAQRLVRALGWNTQSLDIAPLVNGFTAWLAAIEEVAEDIEAFAQTPPESLEDYGELVETIVAVARAVQATMHLSLPDARDIDAEKVAARFVEDLFHYLVVHYLRRTRPFVFQFAAVTRIIEPTEGTHEDEALVLSGDSSLLRAPSRRLRLAPSNLVDLLRDPVEFLKDLFFGDPTPENIRLGMPAVTAALKQLLRSLGFEALSHRGQTQLSGQAVDPDFRKLDDIEPPATRVESSSLKVYPPPALGTRLNGLESIFYVADDGDVTVVSELFGNVNIDGELDGWRWSIQGTSDAGMVAIDGDGVRFQDPADARFGLEVTLEKIPSDQTGLAFTIGGTEGTRLEIGDYEMYGRADMDAGKNILGLGTRAQDSRFVFDPADGDGFLSKVVPLNLDAQFDLGIGWASDRGVYLEGSGGLEAQIPIGLSIADVLELETLTIGVRPGANGSDLPAFVGLTPKITLGPVFAVAEGLGLQFNFDFPQAQDGNLGPVDFGMGFKPPEGIGLQIDAGAITGGGYLFFDPDNERYAGVLELDLGTVGVNAIGLLTTRLPDGSEGFSLLAIITSDFPAIQLGFGFTLNAVGGLLGVNRGVRIPVLQESVRSGGLESVLFPKDPLRNAPEIISDLRQIFPPQKGQYAFGPMLKLGWGTPTLITLELGVILELPAPVRLSILGRISATLPDEKLALISLNMVALGVINFDEQRASVDASLYDSRVVAWTLTGDMALRTSWGSRPGFALSVGGFNPRFDPPDTFPELRRVAVSLGSGGNPRYRLEGYFAVTSNTVQFGARAEFYAGAAGFSVEGHAGFDTLIQFDPFKFIADVSAGAAFKHGSTKLAAVSLKGTLAGPSPFHVRGKASITILFLEASVSFDATFGPREHQPGLPPMDVLPELVAAIEDVRNWSAQLPRDREIVRLRDVDAPDDTVLVHPLGELEFRQTVVPLGIEIQKFGNYVPDGASRFEVTSVETGEPQPLTSLREPFPRAQFLELGDEEKLTGPEFESFTAGHRIGEDGIAFGLGADESDAPVTASTDLAYETEVIDERDDLVPERFQFVMPALVAEGLAHQGAVAKNSPRNFGNNRFSGSTASRVEVADSTWVVSTSDTLTQVDIDGVDARGATRTEVEQQLEQHLQQNPDQRGTLMVVGSHEVA